MAKELKNLIVKEYETKLKDVDNFVVVSYRGVGALESVELRDKLRQSNVMFNVVKNSLVAIVFKELGCSELNDFVDGPSAVATNKGESVDLVKALVACSDKYSGFNLNGGYFDGQKVSAAEIDELSKIPDRSVVNAQILGGIKAPMVGIVSSVNTIMRNLLFCLKEIKGKKQ